MLSFSSYSATFVGDSIAHGFKIASNAKGTTKVGATPKEVHKYLENSYGESLVLSTGASNNCKDVSTIKDNVKLGLKNFKKVTVLSAPYCSDSVNNAIRNLCTTNCKYIVLTPGKDGIHPKYYKID